VITEENDVLKVPIVKNNLSRNSDRHEYKLVYRLSRYTMDEYR